MAERKQIDWEAVEREYRAGQLSNREIGRKFNLTEGAIRKQAKALGWEKDLVEQVRKAVRRKLVRTEVRKNNATEEEIVEAASDRAVAVVEIQRKDINKLRDLEADCIKRLEDNEKIAIVYQGKVTTELPVGLPTRADILQKLAFVAHKRIQLERQAYGMGDGSDDGEGKPVVNIINYGSVKIAEKQGD